VTSSSLETINTTNGIVKNNDEMALQLVSPYLSKLLLICLVVSSHSLNQHLTTLYSEARQVRAVLGHDAAVHLYQDILIQNNDAADLTAATRIGADEESPARQEIVGREGTMEERRRFGQFLEYVGFTAENIADVVFDDTKMASKAKWCSAPIYLQPLKAGSPTPPSPTSTLGACIQLLLLSVCIPLSVSRNYFGSDIVALMIKLGIAFAVEDLLVPYCHVMPVTGRYKTIYVVTDLHPNVLSTTTVGYSEDKDNVNGAVMYIGPDSCGLLHHWCALQHPTELDTIVDIGTGSGIQALSLAELSNNKGVKVKSVDINKRALRVTKLNFDLNGLQEPDLILGNINEPVGRLYVPETDELKEEQSWMNLLGSATLIVSNPPFLPVPADDPVISKRYGWFSSGGSTGEEFLKSLIGLSSSILDPQNSSLGIVSEFMNPEDNFENRLSSWWGDKPAEAILFSNQHALDATTYASRRANDDDEVNRWQKHLESQGIDQISPGFLFLKRKKCSSIAGDDDDSNIKVTHYLVPKTEEGSIWTPTNKNARVFTRNILHETNFIQTQ
jgi:methylase of polypeptide subunit release factors